MTRSRVRPRRSVVLTVATTIAATTTVDAFADARRRGAVRRPPPFAVDAADARPLVPEENPSLAPDARSSLAPHTSVNDVLRGLHALYPPTSLDARNAASRADGYWRYVNENREPPKHLTYGEFDLTFFARLLDEARDLFESDDDESTEGWNGRVFCDVGSGTGRLVLAAAALHPGLKAARGVEVLEGIHNMAEETLEKCRVTDDDDDDGKDGEMGKSGRSYAATTSAVSNDAYFNDIMATLSSFGNDRDAMRIDFDDEEDDDYDEEDEEDNDNDGDNDEIESEPRYALPVPETSSSLPMAPVRFTQGSFTDPYLHLSDVDVAFVFSSCMTPELVTELTVALGRQCRPGTVVVTIDRPLGPLVGDVPAPDDDDDDDAPLPSGPYRFEAVGPPREGYCWVTGGVAIAYLHVLRESTHEAYGGTAPRTRPTPTPERLVRSAIEAHDDAVVERFLRNARNDMIFAGLPPEWSERLTNQRRREGEDEDETWEWAWRRVSKDDDDEEEE